MKKKCLVVGIILLFVGVTVGQSINANMPISDDMTRGTSALHLTADLGTLSGYVTDSMMNPIEGVRVRVYYHNTSRENYSDANGYFHVTDISICNCTKNATCSKEGYHPTWVYIGIWDNTTYDFVLTSKGDWLYVGGNGPGNYSRIQDAIDNASDGDTVYVYSGIYDYYHPNNSALIVINKSINLFGEDKNSTIILNGVNRLNTIRIEANMVNLSGFTINGDGQSDTGRKGIQIYYPSTNINIYNNIMTKHDEVIIVYPIDQQITDINIHDNIIVENNYGIGFTKCEHSLIEIYHNIFSKNQMCIDGMDNYSIYKNLFLNNSLGISLLSSTGMTNCINNNQFEENDIGVRTYNCRQVQIYENNFINNDAHTSVERNTPLPQCFKTNFLLYKQEWKNNYWDDYIGPGPMLIEGHWIIYIYLGGFLFPPHEHNIANIRYKEYDLTPAQEPYDIPG
jgi:hypothetical protein